MIGPGPAQATVGKNKLPLYDTYLSIHDVIINDGPVHLALVSIYTGIYHRYIHDFTSKCCSRYESIICLL